MADVLLINGPNLGTLGVRQRRSTAARRYPAPCIEVDLTNVWARESFRHHSVISPLALGVVAGFGAHGYVLATDALIDALDAPTGTA